jgi:hypothetical protein
MGSQRTLSLGTPEAPKPHHVRARPEGLDIDAESTVAIFCAIFAKSWTFWLAGSPNAAFAANILEPRFGAPWAHVMGRTPAEALGAVLVICLESPPWEAAPDELHWYQTKE